MSSIAAAWVQRNTSVCTWKGKGTNRSALGGIIHLQNLLQFLAPAVINCCGLLKENSVQELVFFCAISSALPTPANLNKRREQSALGGLAVSDYTHRTSPLTVSSKDTNGRAPNKAF